MLAEVLVFTQLNTNLIAQYNMESFLEKKLRRPDVAYPSGLDYRDNSHVKFGPPSIDDPILLIVDPIFNKDMKYIPPGYYQLCLEPGREYMYLVQSGKVVAVIPVFKIEIDKEKEKERLRNQEPKTFFKQKIYRYKQARKERKRQQNIKKKRIDPEQRVYSDATIELKQSEGYFLIKYEKDAVKAWGAIKFR